MSGLTKDALQPDSDGNAMFGIVGNTGNNGKPLSQAIQQLESGKTVTVEFEARDLTAGTATDGQELVPQSMYSATVVNGPLLTGGRSAFRGNVMGVDLWESHHVSTESGGANNFMTAVGPTAHNAIGMVAQKRIQARTTQGDTYLPRLSALTVVSWSDAIGLTFPDGLQECLADAAA